MKLTKLKTCLDFSGHYNLILLDIGLPGISGYEVCEKIKANERTKNIPVLFLTAHTDDASIVKAYNLGASDFVTKPFRPVELIARVKLNLKIQSQFKKLEHAAYYDYMTDVYNRRKFFELAHKKFSNENSDLFAVMFDIDKFKSINDTYGHEVGDIVIKNVAKLLDDNLGKDGIFGRMGGEEFALLYNIDSKEKLMEKIEDVRKKIAAKEVITENNDVIQCTISIGVTQYNDSFATVDHLLHHADEALYEAKETGRDKSIFRI